MRLTEKNFKEILDTANKLIFVKEYREALNLLEELLKHKDARKDCLIHQRRIELGCRLGEVEKQLHYYQEQFHKSQLEPKTGELCIAMVQQLGQLVPTSASIKTFSDIILKYGESAAAYYGIALALDAEGNTERALFNYQQSVKTDANWYPSYFGMSQIYYQKRDLAQGNHYFYLFEQHAPFTLYGNIQTHRKLSEEFLAKKQYREAEVAIRSLGEWWVENRQYCPREIRILEALTLAHIGEVRGGVSSTDYMKTVNKLLDSILEDAETKVEDLQFLSQVLQDYHQMDLCVKVFKETLNRASHDPVTVQKLGMQLLSIGELDYALELFETALKSNPDDISIRFCLLSTRLKMANVDIERYYQKKDSAKKLFDSKEDSAALLPSLRELLQIYSKDSDTHKMMGDLFHASGNIPLAKVHFSKMYEIEPKNTHVALHYASFLIHSDDLNLGYTILKELAQRSHDDEMEANIHSLSARYFERKAEYENAIRELGVALDLAPWNAEFLVQIVRCQMLTYYGDNTPKEPQTTPNDYSQIEAAEWAEFDKVTEKLAESHQTFLVYNRCKLRLLTSAGRQPPRNEWINQAVKFNPSKAALEFLKLLNTNFDSPQLYWGLGVLFREAGSLEIAEMWFEQLLAKTSTPEDLRLQVNLDLSDCYIWRGVNLQKALGYLKIVRDSRTELSELARLKMAHSYLKLGEVRSARQCLQTLSQNPSLESIYLQGLLHYRDGSVQKAKALWKPLLTVKAMSIRDHWIKKEILEFYFQGKSYMKNN